jgi:hypothetical protein
VITLLSILLHRIKTSEELQSSLRLLGMALSCAGFILHLGSGVVVVVVVIAARSYKV